MRKFKTFSLVLAVCLLLSMFTFLPASAAVEDEWQDGAILYPAQEQLIPAGPIWVKWNALPNAVRYIVYLDDNPGEAVTPGNGGTLEYELYTTDVDTHYVWIEAQMASGQSIVTKPRTFYVTKKGIGYFGDLSNMQNMNLSWYYTWNPNPSNDAAVSGLDFVPMFWNGSANAGQVANYKSVLGSNEPDHTGQANTPATTVARSWWPSFVNSGLRIGSPAAAWEYGNEPGQWLYDFMELIKQPDGSYPVDFIAIHDYPGWPGNTDVGADQIEGFRDKIEDLWNRYHKPIWITEFAVANWPSNQDDVQSWGYTKQHVYDYMDKVLAYLDETPYVERYAWFSFGDSDGNPNGESAGSHAALTQRATGQLTALGELYRDSGNPARTPISNSALPPAYGQAAKSVIDVKAGVGGFVTGGGAYDLNSTVVLTATANVHYLFDGWYENNALISANAVLSFTAAAFRTIEARFVIDPSNPPPLPTIRIYDPGNVFGDGAFIYSGVWIDQWYEMCGPWPGIPLQRDGDWLEFDIDLNTINTFIINNGDSDPLTQIKYVWAEDLHNNTDLYFYVDPDALAYNGDNGSKDHYLTQCKTYCDAIEGRGITPGDAVLNIYDPTNQLGDTVYWYGLDTNWWEWPAGSFPGAALQKDADGWVSLQYDLNVLNMIIFNNGTEDVKYLWSRDRHVFNEYWLVVDPNMPVHYAQNGTIERFLVPYTSKADALIGGGEEPLPGRGGPYVPPAPIEPGVHSININAAFDNDGGANAVSTVTSITINGTSISTAPAGVASPAGSTYYFNLVDNGTAQAAGDNGADPDSAQLAAIPIVDTLTLEITGNPAALAAGGVLAGMSSADAYNTIMNSWGGKPWYGIYIFDTFYSPDITKFVVDGETLTITFIIPIEIGCGPVDPPDPPEIENVALNKPVTVDVAAIGNVSSGNDGNLATRFESEHGVDFGMTYVIDLGAAHSVSEVRIAWEAGVTAATNYIIEAAESENGPWTTVYSHNDIEPVLEITESFDEITARYIKLTAYEKPGPWGYSFWEFEVYGYPLEPVPPIRTNVAFGKTAVTSDPGNGAESFGLDGDLGTRFESAQDAGNFELTYTIDLGAVYSVDEVRILWEALTTAASVFIIETAESENGPWTEVYAKTDGDPDMETIETFDAVDARYVKLTAYEKTGPWGYSFWEFEVYGT